MDSDKEEDEKAPPKDEEPKVETQGAPADALSKTPDELEEEKAALAAADADLSGLDEELAEKYINLYCTKQGCTRQYVNEWLGIIAAAELARGRVKETEFLLKWVNVFDAM